MVHRGPYLAIGVNQSILGCHALVHLCLAVVFPYSNLQSTAQQRNRTA